MDNQVIKLAQDLIKFPSVTPEDAGITDYLIDYLSKFGFECQKIIFNDVTNLYARYGRTEPNFCFAGHVDVVPAGEGWSINPFSGIIKDNYLYGRGAVDMKGSIAAFITASIEFIKKQKFQGSISFLITGDEEGKAENGTKKLLEHLAKQNEKIHACIVGEPTSNQIVGDTIKHGRRGSINFDLTVFGKQGHVAYPELAHNPIPDLTKILNELSSLKLDSGNKDFLPSNLEITDIEVGNQATNVIPNLAKARFNIRFNNLHNPQELYKRMNNICERYSNNYTLNQNVGAQCFINNQDSKIINTLKEAITETISNAPPCLSTSGGTSDARFIKDYTQVIEFGLTNKLAHQIDEKVSLDDLISLKKIYYSFLNKYFSV